MSNSDGSKYNTGPDDLVARLSILEARISALELQPRLQNASIDSGGLTVKGGNIRVTNPDGVVQTLLGLQSDGSYGLGVKEAGVTPLHQVPYVYSDFVATSQSTTSVAFTDLATLGPTISVPVRSTGIVLIIFGATIAINPAAGALWGGFMNAQLTGANTVAPTSIPGGLGYSIGAGASPDNFELSISRITLLSGLVAGTTQFQAKYAIGVGNPGETASFRNRALAVIVL